MGNVVARDDEIAAALVLSPHDDVAVRVAGVVVVDGNPIEPGAEILLDLAHQAADEALQLVILGAILGRDDEAELMPVAIRALEKGLPICAIARSSHRARPADPRA